MTTDAPPELVVDLLLAAPLMPSPDAIAKELRAYAPDAEILFDLSRLSNYELTITLDGAAASVALSFTPVHATEYEPACERSWWWEGAVAKVRNHQGVLRITLPPNDDAPALRHVLLSRIVAGLADASRSIAVFWRSAGILHEPGEFGSQVRTTNETQLSPHLWVGMFVDELASGQHHFHSRGLTAFERPELEIAGSKRSAKDLIQYCYNIIYFLISTGTSIEDGDTIGLSEDERITITLGPSSRSDRETEVLHLDW